MEKIQKIVVKLLLAVSLLAVSAASMAGAQQAKGTFWEEIQCPTADGYSEVIYLEGTYRMLMQNVAAGDHTTDIFQVFWEAAGYGMDSEARYLLHGKWMEVIQQNPPYVLIWNDTFKLVGKGKADDFRITWKARVVFNANGDLIMDYFEALQCETLDAGLD